MPAHRNPVKIASDIMDNLGVIDITKLDNDTRQLVKKLHDMSQLEVICFYSVEGHQQYYLYPIYY